MQPRFNATLVALAVSVSACANQTPVVEMKGGCTAANTGTVCTYASVMADQVTDVGATIPLATIENSKPGVMDMTWPPKAMVVSLLPEGTVKQTGFTEMTMYFESTGHPPKPYLVPHYDFHFYLVDEAERQAIDCKDESKPAALAAGYALPDQDLPPDMQKLMGVAKLVGVCVPQMGMHSLPAAELQSDQPFQGTMVIGYYHAKPIFIEPMISRDMLLQKKSFSLPIPEIPGLTGMHPTTFKADYDATANEYHFKFADFKGA